MKHSLLRYLYTAFILFLALTGVGMGGVYYLNPPLLLGLIVQAGLFILFQSLLILFLIREWKRPLDQILRVAERFAQGDLVPTPRISSPHELKILGESLSWMAKELKNRIDTVAFQRNELEGILRGMSEAVILLDGEDRIKTMNHAAETLAHAPSRECAGKRLNEVIKSEELGSFIQGVRKSGDVQEQTLSFCVEGGLKFFQAHGNIVLPPKGGEPNLLIVLNDVTRLKQLEEVRKDFVANVSHELRTPITSVLGFVETLKEGALEDPIQARRFLSIIETQTQRLYALIEDLLSLSRLEQAETKIKKETIQISEIFDEVRMLSESKALEKNIRLEFEVLPGTSTTLHANPSLITQALLNLVDNAIKYSDPGARVRVWAFNKENNLCFSVEDTGPGIPITEQSRIFERFYRIDKTRSRALGGTGLGLAIVKHIALAHGGSVSLESEPGKGSVFSLQIPNPPAPP